MKDSGEFKTIPFNQRVTSIGESQTTFSKRNFYFCWNQYLDAWDVRMEFSASRVEIQENRVVLRCLYGSLLKRTKTRAKRVEMSTSPTEEMR